MRHWALLFCISSVALSATSSHDALTEFYQNFDLHRHIDSFNHTQLCELKWERTEALYGRHSNSNQTRNKGLTGISDNEKIHMYQGKRILLVHVGKAAGGTVNKALLAAGIRSRQIHLHALDATMVAEHDYILLCLRNPIKRAVSAYNWRAPGARNLSAHFNFKPCGKGDHSAFYSCCRSVEEYAHRLTELSACGAIARQGECHTELDTCAYVGGVFGLLDKNSHKVFAIDTDTILSDMNAISGHLGWKKTFEKLPRIHEFEKTKDMTDISASALVKLAGYMEVTGEGPLYRQLLQKFRLKASTSTAAL